MKSVYGLFDDTGISSAPKGAILIYEGDPIKKLYYVISGYVKVYNILDNGSESTIFIYGPGDIFPFTSYLSGSGTGRYFYEAMTGAKFKTMSSKDFELKVKDNMWAGEALIAYTTSVGEQFLQRIDVLSVNNARRKIIALLAFLIDKTGHRMESAVKLAIPLTTQDIANMCGLTRETTSIQLSALRKAGVVSGSKNLTINHEKFSKLKLQLTVSI